MISGGDCRNQAPLSTNSDTIIGVIHICHRVIHISAFIARLPRTMLVVRFARPTLAVLMAATLALGGAEVVPPVYAAPTTHSVDIADFAFAPATLTVAAGDTVIWTNRDPVVHTATSTTGAFDSGDLAQDQSFSLTFTAAGTFDYLCTPHPSMTGRIVVRAPAAEPTANPVPPPAGGSIPNVAMPPPAPGSLVLSGLALLLIIGLALGVGGPGRPRD